MSSLNILWNSPVKPFGIGIFFFGSLLIIDTIYHLNIPNS